MCRILSIIIATVFTSFGSERGVKVFFVNDSEESFVSVTVETGGQRFSFSNLCPGERTRPVVVDKTYWFCHTVVVTQKDTVLFTGFCTVGETLITDGELAVSYALHPKKGKHRTLYASEVSYAGSAKNVGFPKFVWKENDNGQ